MSEQVFLVALGIVAITVVLVATTIAGAISSRRRSGSDVAQLKERLEQHAAALEDAQSALAGQSAQLAELQERLDFAERLLAQGRDRGALGTEDKRR